MNFFNISRAFSYHIFYLFLFFNLSNFSLHALPKKESNADLVNKNYNSLSESIKNETYIDQYILDTGDVLSIYYRNLDLNNFYLTIKDYINFQH